MPEPVSVGFIPNPAIGIKNCGDGPPKGVPSGRYDYILKSLTGDDEYPPLACIPFIHNNILADNLRVNALVTAAQFRGPAFYGTFYGNVVGTASGNKSFDIPHPTKEGWRLRHTCLEGPENTVFFRGKLHNSNTIKLPEYWKGLVNADSITVSLTQLQYSQDLIVDEINDSEIKIKSGNSNTINCHFLIHATRKDSEDLIPEYEGSTPASYPGNNDYYSVAGYNYDVRS